MAPRIADLELLALLGDILGPKAELAAVPLRLRLMDRAFAWQDLVGLASGQDVLPPLIRALSERGLLLPLPRSIKVNSARHATGQLRDAYRQHLARRDLERRQLQGILSALDAAGVVPLLLKGARYLVAPAGPWCEARSMRDIDILVQPAESARAVAALQAAGYERERGSGLVHHHLPEMRRAGEPAALEIHTEAHPAAGQRVMSTDHVWAHATNSGSGPFLVMPIRWHALHGLLHHQVSERGHVRRSLAVKGLWEWTMLTCTFSPEDWDAVAAHMRAAGASDVLGSWLAQSQRLFGLEVPAVAAVSPGALSHAEATFRLASAPHWHRRVRFLADQLRFAFAREILAERYGIPVSQVSPRQIGIHLAYLQRHYRGRMWRRLAGRRDRLS